MSILPAHLQRPPSAVIDLVDDTEPSAYDAESSAHPTTERMSAIMRVRARDIHYNGGAAVIVFSTILFDHFIYVFNEYVFFLKYYSVCTRS